MFAALAFAGPTRLIGVGRAAPWVRATRARVELDQQQREAAVAALPSSQVIDVEETGGLRRSLWGVVRVAQEGGRYAFGDGLAPSRLVDATPVARGWVFRTDRGQLFASASFLGPLRPLRRPEGRCLEPLVRPSHGRAVVRAGAFFANDGEAFTRIETPEPALAVTFGTSAWGVAIMEGGSLAETRDGGRSWRPLTAPVTHGLALRGVIGGVVVTVANGSQLLIQGGPDTPKVGPSRAPREAEPAMRRALVERREGAALRGVVAPEGPCRAALGELELTAFMRFEIARAGRGEDDAPFVVTGHRVAALAGPDARSIRLAGGVARTSSRWTERNDLRWRLLGDPVVRAASIERGSSGSAEIDVLVATRAGLLVSGRGAGFGLVWAGAVGARAAVPTTGLMGVNGLETTTRAVPTEDGGFVLYAMPPELGPSLLASAQLADEPRDLACHRLIRCGSAGCDTLEWYGQSGHAVVRAIGRRGADWGLVVEGATGVSFVTAAGTERMDVDLGAAPTLCGPTRGAIELHVSARDDEGECPASIGPGFDAPNFAACTRVVYEAQGRGLCVRRVEGLRENDLDADTNDGLSAGVWFEARGASLVGGVDDGRTITSLRAVVRPDVPSPMEEE